MDVDGMKKKGQAHKFYTEGKAVSRSVTSHIPSKALFMNTAWSACTYIFFFPLICVTDFPEFSWFS